MKRAPKMLRTTLPRDTMRSFVAGLSPYRDVRTEYRAGKKPTRIKKLAMELSTVRKLDSMKLLVV